MSDNGTEYNNSLLRAICSTYHIDQHFINGYSHEENGIVERANKIVIGHLRAIVNDDNVIDDWSAALPLVRRIMNSMVHTSTGVSPCDLLYGKSFDMDRGIIPVFGENAPDGDHTSNLDYARFVDRMISRQDVLLDTALRTQRDTDLYHIRTHEKAVGFDQSFPINSYVLQKYENDEHRPL